MLSELFNKEGESIYSFKPGDMIVRVKPANRTNTKTNENLGIEMQVIEGIDNSFRSTPLEFLGIFNNLIYLKDRRMSKIFEKPFIHKALLEQFEDNWQIYEIPPGLTLEDCL